MIVKTKKIKVLNIDIDLEVLKYTGLFEYMIMGDIVNTSIETLSEGEFIIFETTLDVNEEYVFTVIEEHQTLQGDYSTLQIEIGTNKFKELAFWVQQKLDTVAISHGYDDIKSCRSYTGFESAFQTECITLSQWASDCWVQAYQLQSDIQNGLRGFPDYDETMSLIPACPLGVGPY